MALEECVRQTHLVFCKLWLILYTANLSHQGIGPCWNAHTFPLLREAGKLICLSGILAGLLDRDQGVSGSSPPLAVEAHKISGTTSPGCADWIKSAV